MTRVLVTGARGFVGRRLVERLASGGYTGLATGRDAPQNLPPGWFGQHRDDVLAGRSPSQPIDAIVHLEVKQHIPRPSAADLKDFERTNIEATHAWLEWAGTVGTNRFVYVSSIKAVQHHGGSVDETAAPEAKDPYGRSKAAAEAAVRAWVGEHSVRSAVILRFAPVYGPGNTANLAAFVRQILRGRPCLVGKGRARKSVLSLLNAVAAIEYAIQTMRPGCEVFNVADQVPWPLVNIAASIAEACNAPPPRSVPWFAAAFLAKLGDAIEAATGRDFVLDSRRLETLMRDAIISTDKLLQTGFVPVQTTREGIAEMARWVRDHDR